MSSHNNAPLILLDTSTPLATCATECGAPVEQLLTPLTRFARQDATAYFSIDNGAFAHFDRLAFEGLLHREHDAKVLCRFVAVPDVVGSARRTLEVFDHWWSRACLHGWRLALVAQDGLEDLSIPWALFDALFIGGTTEWKLGPHARAIIRAGQALEKWIHMGRVNTPGRYEYAAMLGVDSIDGTGLARYSWMRQAIYAQHIQPSLFTPVCESEEIVTP